MEVSNIRISVYLYIFACILGIATEKCLAADFNVGGFYYNILSSVDKTVTLNRISNTGNRERNVVVNEAVIYKDIEYTVTEIADDVLAPCENLVSFSIPKSVVQIGKLVNNIFYYNNPDFSTILVDDENTEYASFDGVLYDKDFTTLMYCPCGKKDVSLSSSVSAISDFAFEHCGLIESLVFKSSLNTIGKSAFYCCYNLKQISGLQNIIEIGERAFNGCESLQSVDLGDSLEVLREWTFGGCLSLSYIVLPSSLTEIGYGAFGLCPNLSYVFIPRGVINISPGGFGCCSSLDNIEIEEGNPIYVNIDGMLIDNASHTLLAYPSAKGHVNIIEGIEIIAGYSFMGNDNVESITFPSSVSLIDTFACLECYNIEWIKCMSLIPPKVGRMGFINDASGSDHFKGNVYVPAQSIELYSGFPYWQYRNLVPFGAENTVEEIDDNVLSFFDEVYTITGLRVLETTDKNRLNGLPKGIYIVNGEKVKI